MCNHAAGRCSYLATKVTCWDKPAGYYREEVKRALRRSKDSGKPYWLKKPARGTLTAIFARLTDARLDSLDDGKSFSGPRAAEEYVAFRRAQLGLDREQIEAMAS